MGNLKFKFLATRKLCLCPATLITAY